MTEPERALPSGYELSVLLSVDSTMLEAERRAAASTGDGCIILAHEQTAGRGRRGRVWSTPPGNLAFSILLRPDCSLPTAALFGFVCGLSLFEAVRPHIPVDHRLAVKWPNDLLLDGAKLSGLLLESRSDSQGGLEWLVAGMGVNLAWAPKDMPYRAIALSDVLAAAPSAKSLTIDWAWRFVRWRAALEDQGFEPVRAAWKAAAVGLGGPLTARLADGTVLNGRFQDLDENGALLLSLPGERLPRTVTAGEVYFPKETSAAAGH